MSRVAYAVWCGIITACACICIFIETPGSYVMGGFLYGVWLMLLIFAEKEDEKEKNKKKENK